MRCLEQLARLQLSEHGVGHQLNECEYYPQLQSVRSPGQLTSPPQQLERPVYQRHVGGSEGNDHFVAAMAANHSE